MPTGVYKRSEHHYNKTHIRMGMIGLERLNCMIICMCGCNKLTRKFSRDGNEKLYVNAGHSNIGRKGQTSWSKGKTKLTNDSLMKTSQSMKGNTNGLGRKATSEQNEKKSIYWKLLYGMQNLGRDFTQSCKCGCGQIIPKYRQTKGYDKASKYVRGHKPKSTVIVLLKCKKEINRKYRYYNKEMINEKSKIRYYKDIDETKRKARLSYTRNIVNIEKSRKKWTESNPDYFSQNYQAKKELKIQNVKDWVRDNPEKRKVIALRHEALKHGAVGSHSGDEWIALIELLNHKCNECWKYIKNLTQDHIIPLTKGGSDFIDNIQPLCQSCNSSKHAKYPIPNLIKVIINGR